MSCEQVSLESQPFAVPNSFAFLLMAKISGIELTIEDFCCVQMVHSTQKKFNSLLYHVASTRNIVQAKLTVCEHGRRQPPPKLNCAHEKLSSTKNMLNKPTKSDVRTKTMS